MDSKELIELLKVKDARAIAALYDQYAPLLYGIILKVAPQHEEAETILENTFLTILKDVQQYNGSTHVLTWMVCIARSMAQKSIRPATTPTQASGTTAAEEQLIKKYAPELTEDMETQSRRVLTNVYFQNRSIPETSSILGIPSHEVKVLLRSALHHIQNKTRPGARMLSITTLIISLTTFY